MRAPILPLVPIVLAIAGAPSLPQEPVPIRPDPAALAALAQGLRSKDPLARAGAIQSSAKLDGAEAAKLIGKGLRDRDPLVKGSAVRALRYMKSKEALSQLLKVEKVYEKDKDLGPEYYLALGQLGDPRALPVILHRAWDPETAALFRARMMALAHIRSPKSVAELVKLNNKFRSRRGQGGAHRRITTQAMELLTGRKAPRDKEAQRAWWLEAKKIKHVPEKPSGLPAKELRSWEKMWAPPGEEGKDSGEKRKRKRRRKND